MRPPLHIVLLVSALLALNAAPAPAARRAVVLGPARGAQLRTDGRRWIAWSAAPGVSRVLDARTGELRDVTDPEGCGLADVGAGQLLWSCSDPAVAGGYPLLMRLSDGAIHLPRGVDAVTTPTVPPGCDAQVWAGVGAQWIVGRCEGYHYSDPEYLNWHTGALRAGAARERTRVQTDLDRGGLLDRLCSPLRRPRNPDADLFAAPDDLRLSFLYHRPWAVLPHVAATAPLRVQRCGRHAPRILDRCRRSCTSVGFGSGLVTWWAGGPVRAARPGGHARTVARASDLVALAQARGLVLAVRARGQDTDRAVVLAWRLPGAAALPSLAETGP